MTDEPPAQRMLEAAERRLDRSFGLGLGGVLTLLGSWWLWQQGPHTFALLPALAGLTLLALALIVPQGLRPARALFSILTRPIGFLITRAVLGLIYYLVLTPIGVIKRLSGWDPLQRRCSPQAAGWKPYASHPRDPKHFDHLF